MVSASSSAMFTDEYHKQQDERHKAFIANNFAMLEHQRQNMALHSAYVTANPMPGQRINTTALDAELKAAGIDGAERMSELMRATNHNNSLSQ